MADLAARGVHPAGSRPFLTPWTSLPPADVARHVLQQHWSRLGSWQPEDWALELGVFRDGQPLGIVALKASEFAVLREVRTGSWLGLEHHGQGLGTEAREAVLTLAFDGLAAVAATSVAFTDNAGSLGVSRRLGYQEDGITRDALHGEAVVSQRLRLTRQGWEQRAHPLVMVEGLQGCEAFFGVRTEG